MNDDDLTSSLHDELRNRADAMHGSTVGLADVTGRARTIRRRRAATAVAGVVAAVVLIVPTAAVAGHELGGHRNEPLPATQDVSPTPTAQADPRAPLEVTGLPTGAAPRVGFLRGGTLHLPGGSSVPVATADPVDRYVLLTDGTVVFLTRSDQGTTHVEVTDPQGARRGPYPAGDGLVADPSGTTAAWIGPDGHPRIWRPGATQPFRMAGHVPGDGLQVQAVTAGDCASTDPAGAGGCQVLVRTHDQATGATADWLVSSDGGVDRAAPSARFVGVTSLAGSGTEVGLTRVRQDGSSCSGIAGQSGPVAWQTCSHTLLAFSPDGSYVSADTAYHDGAGSSVLAAYGANGDLAFDHLSTRRAQAFVQTSVWEDDTHLLGTVFQGGRWSVVRFGVDGSMELAVPSVPGDVARSPLVLPGER